MKNTELKNIERPTGIIIAAGAGARMGELTHDKPKCLLQVAGRTILEHTIDQLRSIGCSDIILVVGHKSEMIDVANVRYVRNDDYKENNILHSLMKAREYVQGPVVVSYSDIWVEPWVFQQLTDTPGDIVLAADQDWQPYYEGRTMHPISEAENVFFDRDGAVVSIGKHLAPGDSQDHVCGEFIGLWRMSSSGSACFREEFERIDAQLGPDSSFQRADRWQRAYVTDMFQELVNRGATVNCAVIERGWAELDTEQDFRRLPEVAHRQRLATIYETNGRYER